PAKSASRLLTRRGSGCLIARTRKRGSFAAPATPGERNLERMAMNESMIGMESLEAERADTMARLRESREELRFLDEKKLLGEAVSESRYAELKAEIDRLARRHS